MAQVLDKTPIRVIQHAVKGMLPKSGLGRRMLLRLKVYAGPDHPHEAQIKGSQRAQEGAVASQPGQDEQEA